MDVLLFGEAMISYLQYRALKDGEKPAGDPVVSSITYKKERFDFLISSDGNVVTVILLKGVGQIETCMSFKQLNQFRKHHDLKMRFVAQMVERWMVEVERREKEIGKTQ